MPSVTPLMSNLDEVTRRMQERMRSRGRDGVPPGRGRGPQGGRGGLRPGQRTHGSCSDLRETGYSLHNEGDLSRGAGRRGGRGPRDRGGRGRPPGHDHRGGFHGPADHGILGPPPRYGPPPDYMSVMDVSGPHMHGPGPHSSGPHMHGPGPHSSGPRMHGPGPRMHGPGPHSSEPRMHGPGPRMHGPGPHSSLGNPEFGFPSNERRGRGRGPYHQDHRGRGPGHSNVSDTASQQGDHSRGRGNSRGHDRGARRSRRPRGGRRGCGERRNSCQSEGQDVESVDGDNDNEPEEEYDDNTVIDGDFNVDVGPETEIDNEQMKALVREILKEQPDMSVEDIDFEDLVLKVRQRMTGKPDAASPPQSGAGKGTAPGPRPKKVEKVQMPATTPLDDVVVVCKKAGSGGTARSSPVQESDSDSDTSVISTTDSVTSTRSARRRKNKRRNKPNEQKEEEAQTGPTSRNSDNKKPEATAEQPIAFDDYALFERVVKVYCGECRIQDLRNDASGLMPPDAETMLHGFIKSPWFKVFKARDPDQIEQSLIIVHHKDVKMCNNYGYREGCTLKFCPFLHLCKSFVQGYCPYKRCHYSHSLEDEHNHRILTEKKLTLSLSPADILCILKCSTLQVCPRYSETGHCAVLDKLMTCPQIHICQDFVKGKCSKTDSNCAIGHSFDTSQAKFLMGTALYKMTKIPTGLMTRCILVMAAENGGRPAQIDLNQGRRVIGDQGRPVVERSRGPSQPHSSRGNLNRPPERPVIHHNDHRPVPEPHLVRGVSELSVPERVPEPSIPAHRPSRAVNQPLLPEPRVTRPREPIAEPSQDDWTVVHIHDEDGRSRNICEANLSRRCRYGARTCRQDHYPLPYLWQVRFDGQWISLTQENENIETRFSDVNENTYHIAVQGRLYCLHFDEMEYTVTDDTLQDKVRRLSTRGYTEPERDAGPFITQWRWYWIDEHNSWKPYEVDVPPYQGIIESKYQAKEAACFFEHGQFRYLLDLEKMEQVNLVTNKKRQVRRRSLSVTAEDVRNRKRAPTINTHIDKSLLPKGWSPMNTDRLTMPDLIALKAADPNYQLVQAEFCKTLDSSQMKIQRVIRVQNLNLWDKYNRKKKEMEQSLDVQVDERQLFHGTSSEDTVRCICKQGFDSRVSGKNGTMYGKGSYFARDANYSNNYTNRHQSKLQYMFMVRVLVGKYTLGKPEYSRPPRLDDHIADSDLYNACVDRMTNPGIFVIFYEDQCYPEYLIEYKETSTSVPSSPVRKVPSSSSLRQSVPQQSVSYARRSPSPPAGRISPPSYIRQVSAPASPPAQYNAAPSAPRPTPPYPAASSKPDTSRKECIVM